MIRYAERFRGRLPGITPVRPAHTGRGTPSPHFFDVELLASRRATATRWVRGLPELRTLPIGYFGANTGAAAALWAAADDMDIAAVVNVRLAPKKGIN